MIYIIPIITLFIFWYLNLKSDNKFFYQEEKKIRQKLDLCLKVCEDFEWSVVDCLRLRISFEYFILNPNEFNGTSVINDNWVIKGLEPESVQHDYDWIHASSLKQLLESNLRYVKLLRKRNVNWFWCWCFIFISLNIVSFFKSLKFIN